MRVKPIARPINRLRLGTFWVGSTVERLSLTTCASAIALFFIGAAATLTIGLRDPRLEYGLEFVIFLLAGYWFLVRPLSGMKWIPGAPLLIVASWGFLQLALGATVYRFATLQSSLRFAAMAAAAWVSCRTFQSRRLENAFLHVFAWFGAVMAVISVSAYFTSPGKILWIFDAPYPDVWGPFLSRNNFAQFLELCLPAALWLAWRERSRRVLYLCFASIILASGLVSASRAGSFVLILETVFLMWLKRKGAPFRKMAIGLLAATALVAAIAGLGNLAGRLASSDPFQGRREIARSTLAMIESRPWQGYGLGTFSAVYPAYATFDTGKIVEHAHNDWLEWASEGGLGFAAVWMVLCVWSVSQAIRVSWALGVAGCFLHALVDYPFARLGVSVWALILLGMLAASELREVRHRVH